ncbi:MAG: GTP cyclohydrolase I FolE [Chloroflexi bacterium]|nr:GTP cyclohydrolase I FolE [Chloroflexota bacterium]
MSINPARRSDANGVHTNGHAKLAALDGGALRREERFVEADGSLLEAAARDLLIGVGEDPSRDGLLDTPRRVRKSMEALTEGYRMDPRDVVGDALFEVEYDDMVLVKDIEFYSLCEHHLLPFFGRVHIGYLPQGHVVGLSKLPRLVDVFARRLQVQERLTRQVAACIQELLDPSGVGVVIEASHLCMMMRGVEKQQSTTRTSTLLGQLRNDDRARAEFLALTGDRR